MADRQHIGMAWQAFALKVMNPEAGTSQRRETKLAFFAGARAMLRILNRLADEDVPEDDGIVTLNEIDNELHAFAVIAKAELERVRAAGRNFKKKRRFPR